MMKPQDFEERNEPRVVEIILKKYYKFMYENFLISSQHELFLFLEENNGVIDIIKFNFKIYKYGFPNDEALGAHPMAKFGLGFYGLFEVYNSPWIIEVLDSNRVHPKHIENRYSQYKHYIARFKDVTLDVICSKMEELQISKEQLAEIINKEIKYIKV